MTEEMALLLLKSKDVYLTKEGRQWLTLIVNEVTPCIDLQSGVQTFTKNM